MIGIVCVMQIVIQLFVRLNSTLKKSFKMLKVYEFILTKEGQSWLNLLSGMLENDRSI